MSNTSEFTSLVCANCGKEGSDVTNTCNKCKSVMYCNAACKKKHRHKHKKECERRVAEKHDEKLFKQPPPLEDCPICFLRLPLLGSGRTYMNCCGKLICSGCIYAPVYDDKGNVVTKFTCPFCRTPPASSNGESLKRFEKRIELNDARAIYNMGVKYYEGTNGLRPNRVKALELWHRSGQLGFSRAYYGIATAYYNGNVVERDEKKAKYYYELAAMAGDTNARHNLGVYEERAGNMDRALKHWMIAAKDGSSRSLNSIREYYLEGHATKDDYADALQSHQAYLDEIKSDQRDESEVGYYESTS